MAPREARGPPKPVSIRRANDLSYVLSSGFAKEHLLASLPLRGEHTTPAGPACIVSDVTEMAATLRGLHQTAYGHRVAGLRAWPFGYELARHLQTCFECPMELLRPQTVCGTPAELSSSNWSATPLSSWAALARASSTSR